MRRAYRCCLELHFCHLSWRLRPAVSPLHSSERAVRVRVVVVGSAGTAALLAYVVALYNSRRRSGPLKNTRGARSGIATGSLRGTRAAPHQIHRSRFARECRSCACGLRPARPKPHVTHGVFYLCGLTSLPCRHLARVVLQVPSAPSQSPLPVAPKVYFAPFPVSQQPKAVRAVAINEKLCDELIEASHQLQHGAFGGTRGAVRVNRSGVGTPAEPQQIDYQAAKAQRSRRASVGWRLRIGGRGRSRARWSVGRRSRTKGSTGLRLRSMRTWSLGNQWSGL